MKGRDFGYIAKRHGTLEKRRKEERRRIRAAKLDERMGPFRRELDVASELMRLERSFRGQHGE